MKFSFVCRQKLAREKEEIFSLPLSLASAYCWLVRIVACISAMSKANARHNNCTCSQQLGTEQALKLPNKRASHHFGAIRESRAVARDASG